MSLIFAFSVQKIDIHCHLFLMYCVRSLLFYGTIKSQTYKLDAWCKQVILLVVPRVLTDRLTDNKVPVFSVEVWNSKITENQKSRIINLRKISNVNLTTELHSFWVVSLPSYFLQISLMKRRSFI